MNPLGQNSSRFLLGSISRVLWFALALCVCGSSSLAQSQQPNAVPEADSARPDAPGTIDGTVLDQTGTAVVGAHITLTLDDQSAPQEVYSGENGQFVFPHVAPGSFHLSIAAPGFTTMATSGVLRPGQNYTVPQFSLSLATNFTEVHVFLTPVEIATEQLKDQEKQRVFGLVPNFYVTYVPNAAPLNTRQKYNLAWKTMVDPVTFGVVGVIAGIDQASNRFSGYGQGAQGFGKRYGASYANALTETFIGGAVLPSLLKQDPRYFYKGRGTKRSRLLYAVANAVICKGDNGKWETNYSTIVGSFAAGGISNLYYPASDRNGAGLTIENGLIGIGATAATNILQEFVLRRFTPSAANSGPSQP